MKKYIYMLLTIAPILFASCSNDDDLPAVKPTDRGTVTDSDGNVYEWVRIGDLQWTTSNAKNGPDVWECTYFDRFTWKHVLENYYGRIPQSAKDDYNLYRQSYGNLMNYASAVASAPDGWRLPTDEDWQKLERHLGMSDTGSKGCRGNGQAFRLQESGTGTELAMIPGGGFIFEPSYGWVSLTLQYQDVYGFYWTSTVDPSYIDEETVYYRKFLSGNGSIWRECSSAQQLMSVRWVKDAE